MEIIRPGIKIDFVGKMRIAVFFSLALIFIGIASLVMKGGPALGIDFAGGTLVQVRFAEQTGAQEIRGALRDVDLGSVTVQQFGDDPTEFLIRAQETSAELERLSQRMLVDLERVYGAGNVEIRRVEMVGPQVGAELRTKGILALAYALVGTLIYISWRFEFRFAIGAILALAHDVILTLGIFSLLNLEIDLPIIAAFLAIIGYSLNDTIIIFDRIRENMGKHGREGFASVVNLSINETLSRTILTSGTTLMVLLSLFIFGGGVIHNFALALLIGVFAGTYSTIFIASAFVIHYEKKKPVKMEEALVEGGHK
jgi:preprotein translocase subunit SecF